MVVTIETLAEKAAAYQIGGEHLVSKIHEILDALIKVLPDPFTFTAKGVAFTTDLAHSNVGGYGAALCYSTIDESADVEYMSPVSNAWSNAGSDWYLHGDFSVTIRNATRDQIKQVGKALPDFIEAMAASLDRKTEEMRAAGDILDKMIDAAKQK